MVTDPTDSSANIIQVIKSRRMRWTQHVAHMVDLRSLYRPLAGRDLNERHHLEDLDGRQPGRM
jgi:hypothetical protein